MNSDGFLDKFITACFIWFCYAVAIVQVKRLGTWLMRLVGERAALHFQQRQDEIELIRECLHEVVSARKSQQSANETLDKNRN
jgi:hypothetical protein